MKVVIRPRRGGKTCDAIKIAADTNSFIVCFNKAEAARVADQANRMGARIPYPLIFEQIMDRQHLGLDISGLVIDNVDAWLYHLVGVTPIRAITITAEELK